MNSSTRLIIRLAIGASLFATASICTLCQSGSPAKNTTKVIEHASWQPSAEGFVGLTEDEFKNMGLHKLTKYEYASLLIWINQSQISAAQKAKPTRPTYSCGREPSTDAATLNKVKLFLSFNENSPSELTSGIRQRIRTIQDIEIVYDEKDSDIVASFLAFENETEGGRHTGFTISLVTSTPCVWQFGELKGQYRSQANHFLQIAPNATQAIEAIVTKLDAEDIEGQRKTNAMWRRAYEGQKKP